MFKATMLITPAGNGCSTSVHNGTHLAADARVEYLTLLEQGHFDPPESPLTPRKFECIPNAPCIGSTKHALTFPGVDYRSQVKATIQKSTVAAVHWEAIRGK